MIGSYDKNRKSRGFTLVEILVTVTIFAIVVTAFLGLFSSAFRSQRKNLSIIYLLNNTSYISEYMSRSLRMAKKDLSGACIGEKENFEITINGIKFLNYEGECQEFFIDNKILKVAKNDFSHSLTSSGVEVESLKFEVLGSDQTDTTQPRVSFALILRTVEESTQEIKLQSTISQRNLDVPR